MKWCSLVSVHVAFSPSSRMLAAMGRKCDGMSSVTMVLLVLVMPTHSRRASQRQNAGVDLYSGYLHWHLKDHRTQAYTISLKAGILCR